MKFRIFNINFLLLQVVFVMTVDDMAYAAFSDSEAADHIGSMLVGQAFILFFCTLVNSSFQTQIALENLV